MTERPNAGALPPQHGATHGGDAAAGGSPRAEVTLHVAPETAARWRDAHADVIVHAADGSATLLHGVLVHVATDGTASDVVSADAGAGNPVSGADAGASTSRRAVVSMDSTCPEAETLFRSAIVALDGIPGNEVEGISPLYHVSSVDGPDAMAAVVQLGTRFDARRLIAMLGAIEASHADQIDLDLIDLEGETCDEPDCRVPWPSARRRAAVLAPWLDMDPDARLGRDPVAFLLAMAPDADRVGLLSADWVLGADA